MEIKIDKQNQGERLDKFLSSLLKDLSRSQIQKKIKSGEIKIEGREVPPHYFLRTGEIIEIKEKNEQEKNNKIKTGEKLFKKIKVIAEEKDFLIIYKPVGLVVHSAPGVKDFTLVDYLLKKYPDIKKVGEDCARSGLVHRLDKEVSGLIVVARNQKSFLNLKKQFQNREVEKEYIALVHGQIENQTDTIDFPIKRSTKGFKMAAVPHSYQENEQIREAKTHLTVLEKYTNITLIKLKIETGRTHQIRVHMLAYGHPVVGDPVYKIKGSERGDAKLFTQKQLPARLYLEAVSLSFKDLSGQRRKFKIQNQFKKEMEELNVRGGSKNN